VSTLASLSGALWYLRVHSLVGRVRSRLARLKQPKYLAGAVVGALYFYFAFLRRIHAGPPQGPGALAEALPPGALPLIGEFGALALLVVLAVNWCFPRRAALAFSEAEIAFLFPAPVSRRMLVHYRLLGAQFGLFFTALVFTLVFGRGRGFGAHAWYQFFGWWLVLALVNLHVTATSFVWSRVLSPNTSARRRVAMIVAGAALALALIAWIVRSTRLPTDADFGSAANATRYLMEVLQSGPLPWLLALPKLVLAPYFAQGPAAFALAMIPALILLGLHYVWVVNIEVAFEEATIARAEKRAARRRAGQRGDWRGNVAVAKARKPAFALGGEGRPELAFLWKNLLATSDLFRVRPMAILTIVLVAAASWLASQPDLAPFRMMFSVVAMIVLVMTVLLGPQVARQDLRTDLANADLLKTYPLRGWQIVLGEMLTPVAILSVVFWIALATVYVLLPGDSLGRIPAELRGEIAMGLAVLAPPFIAIQVLMPNAATVLFPAWVQATRDQTERGIEVLGQRLIFVASQLLVTALVIVPALLVGGFVFIVANVVAGPAAGAVLAVIVMAALLAVEAWLGIRWLGRLFEELDISSELRA
jgi:ABC-2 type transport system permease protein